MSLYQVNKLLRDINCSMELAQRCQREPETVLQQYDLTPEEKGAVTGWQVRKLYDMGANPLYRWMGLFMDKLTGPDFDAGLANLKAVAEKP